MIAAVCAMRRSCVRAEEKLRDCGRVRDEEKLRDCGRVRAEEKLRAH